jgi:hypothetical protein
MDYRKACLVAWLLIYPLRETWAFCLCCTLALLACAGSILTVHHAASRASRRIAVTRRITRSRAAHAEITPRRLAGFAVGWLDELVS